MISPNSYKGDSDALRVHNEVIEQAKYQMWPLDKKIRVVQQAKEYVKKHNSEMEERLAQSKTCTSRVQQLYFYCLKYLMVINFYLLHEIKINYRFLNLDLLQVY